MADETRWLNDEEMTAWRSVLRAHATVVASLDRELTSAHGLGLPDYDVLQQLSEVPQRSLRMTELAHSVMLSPSGLTRRLDGLVKQGYVERQPCPSDGRGLLAVLTEKGRDKVHEMSPTHVHGVRQHFIDCVDPAQLRDLIRVFQPIAEKDGNACIDVSNHTVRAAQQNGNPVAADITDKQPVTTG